MIGDPDEAWTILWSLVLVVVGVFVLGWTMVAIAPVLTLPIEVVR